MVQRFIEHIHYREYVTLTDSILIPSQTYYASLGIILHVFSVYYQFLLIFAVGAAKYYMGGGIIEILQLFDSNCLIIKLYYVDEGMRTSEESM